MVRSPARHQADPARRQLGEDLRHRTAPKLRAQHRRFGLVDPMHLKDMLGGVQTNPDNPHRTAPLLDCTITAWHYPCRRGPSTPTFFSYLGRGSAGPGFAGTLAENHKLRRVIEKPRSLRTTDRRRTFGWSTAND